MRGIAALGVLVFHVFLALPFAGIEAPHLRRLDVSDGSLLAQHMFLGLFNGRALVTLFFVLSGCVLAMSLDRNRTFGIRDLPSYWVRRGFRLYPLLILAATLGALLQTQVEGSAHATTSDWAEWHYNVPQEDLPREWIKNAIGLSSSLNSPAWSIRVELLASFIFPALYWCTRRSGRALVSGVILILLMFLPTTYRADLYDMNVYAFSFFTGALVPRYGAAGANWFGAMPGSWRRLALTVILISFLFGRRLIYPGELLWPPVVLAETLCAAAIVTLVMFRPMPRFFSSRIAQRLGEISYGIYLLHLIVLFALIHAFVVQLPALQTSGTVLVALLLCAATLAITIPLSALLHRLFEQPMQQVGSGIARALTNALNPRGRGFRPLPPPR